MPTAHTGYLQFYINCAFVNIIGPGGGTPTEFVTFPGTYQDDDPGNDPPSSAGQRTLLTLYLVGFLVPPNQDLLGGPVKADGLRLMEYKPPGPAVWTG